MNTFMTREELKQLHLKAYGEDVLIGKYAVLYHPERLIIGSHVRIDDFTVISGNVILGDYIHISHFCGLYGGTEGIIMEDFSTLASKCSIFADSDDYSGNSMVYPAAPDKYKPCAINARVQIKKNVIIGCNSVILPGVVLEEGTAVGSMSLCNRSTIQWSIYAGVPARRLRERKKEILNLEQKFLEENGC